MDQKLFVSRYLVALPSVEKLRRCLAAGRERIESPHAAALSPQTRPTQPKILKQLHASSHSKIQNQKSKIKNRHLEINSKLRVLAAFAADQDQKIILSPSNPSLQYAAPQTLALLAASSYATATAGQER